MFPTVLDWLRAGCAGVVLHGAEAETREYLLSCRAGIVVPDVAYGQRLQKLMRRPIQSPPDILVRVAA